MAIFTSENRSAWQALADSLAPQRPDVGKRVRVVSGRKHLNAEGRVTWHGIDKFSDANRYATDAQAALREMEGRRGYRVRILADNGETFFISAEKVIVVEQAAAVGEV